MELSLPSWPTDPAAHRAHPLHTDPDNHWIDANCYVDLWIELLNGLCLDPSPALGCALEVDFEGDQWTFFKPALDDLRVLYGVDVIELAVYRPLAEHCRLQLSLNRIPLLEADGYFLPDLPGTYRARHTKTTIGLLAVDPDERRARYLHNAGCFSVHSADFDGVFHTPAMAPYVEVVKLDRLVRHSPAELLDRGRSLARSHLARRPADNPVRRFADRFAADVAELREREPAVREGYSFAVLRQMGAANAFAARFLTWLDPGLAESARACAVVSAGAKRLILKTARALAKGTPVAAGATLDEMAEAWDWADRGLRTYL